MGKIKLNILGLSTGQTTGSYTIILSEENGIRKLPVIIGSFEAQAIAIEIEKIVPFRPMTHDLFVNFCKAFGIFVHEVVIYNLHEGVFHAKIICELDGEIKEIDARTSDSIALAVRFKCPIYTYEDIMAEAGIELTDEQFEVEEDYPVNKPTETEKQGKKELTKLTEQQLQQKLADALKTEDYTLAAKIRDELNRRKQM
ncbi:MAG: bifunctional nuclease domain-containing protein [Bacteroidia bacterium]